MRRRNVGVSVQGDGHFFAALSQSVEKARFSPLSRPPHTDAKMTRSLTRSLQVKPDHRRLSNNIVTGKRPLKEEFVLLLNYASASISISRVLPGQALDAFLYRVSHKAGRTWIKLVDAFCPSRMVRHLKYKSTQPMNMTECTTL